MAFIMPAFAIAKHFLIYVGLLMLISTASLAMNFDVRKATITKVGNGYNLTANISYPLTPRVKEAIHNGVPIVFYQQLKIIDSLPILGDFWQWERTLWETKLRYQLRYHALTNQHVIIDLDTRVQRNFISLESALHALGTIEAMTLPPEHMNDSDNLHVYVRSGLDLFSLPTPMRPGALISSKWQLESPWTEASW